MKNISAMRADNLMDNAAALYNNKKYEDAIRIYLSVEPPTVNTMLGAATSYQQLGDRDNAIVYYKKALELKPVDSDIAYYIAVLYGEKEDYANAKNYLGKALAFNKNNQQALEYLKSIEDVDMANLLNSAIEKYEAEKYDEALPDFNKLLSKNANNDYALYYRGMIYDSQGKHNEAIADLKKAYELNKDFVICNYMIGSNYDALKKYKEAIEYYEIYANSNAPDDDYKKYAKARAEELKENAGTTAKK
jgi:tetratricopeptide (TPR) repeat protein